LRNIEIRSDKNKAIWNEASATFVSWQLRKDSVERMKTSHAANTCSTSYSLLLIGHQLLKVWFISTLMK